MLHVKESSGKQPERGIGSGKAEAYEFEPLDQSGVPDRSWKQIAMVTNEGPTMYSRERQQSDAQTSNTGKQERRDESSNSAMSA